MMRTKIKLDDVRRIVKEELKAIHEQVDHAAIKDVVTGASKLLAAVEAFKGSAPPSAINAVTPHMGSLERVLEDMVNSPGSYVARPKVEPKKVSLRAVKAEAAVHEQAGDSCKKCDGSGTEPNGDDCKHCDGTGVHVVNEVPSGI